MGCCCPTQKEKFNNAELAVKFRMNMAQVDECERVFKEFDINGDGKISAHELGTAMEKITGLKHSKEALKTMIQTVDKNHSGAVEFPEFISLMSQMKNQMDKEKEAEEAFNIFDKNHDGNVSIDELRQGFQLLEVNVGDKELHSMLSAADKDHDGQIGRAEFLSMYRKLM